MAWPTTKEELLQGVRDGHRRLEEAMSGLTEKDMVFRDVPGAWSVKDILCHVTAWEKSLLQWYQTGLRGEKQEMPDWKKPGVIDGINQEIYERNLERQLGEVMAEFQASYESVLTTVEAVPEEVMFTHGEFDWTGEATLAQYIVANTSGHYAEHIPPILAIRKTRGK